MNKDYIPFVSPSFGSFLGSIFTFAALGFVIHAVQIYQDWCRQVVMTLAGQKRWDRTMRPRLVEMLRYMIRKEPVAEQDTDVT
jgi:hypothetical protein